MHPQWEKKSNSWTGTCRKVSTAEKRIFKLDRNAGRPPSTYCNWPPLHPSIPCIVLNFVVQHLAPHCQHTNDFSVTRSRRALRSSCVCMCNANSPGGRVNHDQSAKPTASHDHKRQESALPLQHAMPCVVNRGATAAQKLVPAPLCACVFL